MRAHYLEVGDGPTLVLLASMLVRARTYAPLIARLAPHFRVLAVELPGSGRSSRLTQTWGLEEYADWSERFLNAVAVERAIIVGHSNSGAVALLMGARRPERVSSLVLADAIGARQSHSLFRLLLARAVDAALEPGLSARGWPDVAWNLLFHTGSFLHQVRLAARADVLQQAPAVVAPTLVAWGRKDHTMPLVCSARLRAVIPGSRLHLSEGSHDHCIAHADEFARSVSKFVESVAVPS